MRECHCWLLHCTGTAHSRTCVTLARVLSVRGCRLQAIRGADLTAEEAKKAAILGWCIEWVSVIVLRLWIAAIGVSV